VIEQLDEVSRRRIAKMRQNAIETTAASLRQTLGDGAQDAIASPTTRAAIERYVDTIMELMRTHGAFLWADATTTAPFVDAAIAYRDAQLALNAAIEIVTREALGLTEH
jgi:hypothetical protein